MNKLLRVLMERDGLTKQEALEKMDEAREQMYLYLEEGDGDSASEVCGEFFGLEEDYLYCLL